MNIVNKNSSASGTGSKHIVICSANHDRQRRLQEILNAAGHQTEVALAPLDIMGSLLRRPRRRAAPRRRAKALADPADGR